MKLNRLTASCLAGLLSMGLAGCGGSTEEDNTPPPPITPTNISLASQSITVKEGGNGERKEVTVTVRLSKVHDQTVSLNYALSSENESADRRYEHSAGKAEISAGEREAKLNFTVLGNERHEQDGRFKVNLTLDPNAKNVNLLHQAATIIISDDDPVPTVNLTVTDVDVREGVGNVEIMARLDRPSYLPVSARLNFDGLASSNDYAAQASTIEFDPDAMTGKTNIIIFEDDVIEGSETIEVSLQSVTNAELGQQNAMRIIIQGDLKLNDTGVVSYYNNGDFNSNTPGAGFEFQDADFGLDQNANYNTSNGFAGLFYNKIDGSGNALPETTTDHECVYDAHTGLTWEIKGEYFYHEFAEDPDREEEALEIQYTGQHFNNRNGRYMWYSDDSKKNGGAKGGVNDKELIPPVLASQNCMFPHRDHPLYVSGVSQKGCTTDKYVELIQKSAMCGFIDWRLPTINELQTLVVYEQSKRGYDTHYFPDSLAHEASNTSKDFVYLSSTPSVDNEASVWCLDAAERRVKLCNKTDHNHVRLVRGNQF